METERRTGMASAARGLQGLNGTPANPPGSMQPSSRLRRRARSTEVDESLFGPHGPVVLLRDARSSPKSAPGAQHRPETIRLLGNGLIRSLVVPSEKPTPALIIGLQDFQRIQESSRVQSKEQREAELAALKAQREAELEAMNERKAAAKRQTLLQQSKPSELEEEAKERAQHLLQRANRMRMEQEDEIKEFSELLLGVKCHMIRDTQILEKRQIGRELEEEEKRLARMMEVERQKADEMQEELEGRRKRELMQGRQELVKQIEKNAEERALRAEQKDQESQEMLRYLEQLKVEEQKELEQKKEQQKKIQAEIKRINDESQRCKEEQLQKEKMEDERVLEYQRQKMEREAELEAEQERIRREKEKEVAQLRAMQEKALDQQAERDALRAKRSQEAAEREWRRKEKEAARRKAEMEEQLRQGRRQQIAEKEQRMAVQGPAEADREGKGRGGSQGGPAVGPRRCHPASDEGAAAAEGAGAHGRL
ncbi:cilia- and flagella-associated protein 45 isoform X2 [Tympanuchus pallidicinctus]|uniref:cilia- and flagella-associated protein 45 isoform X2 n=1 Tax=Tympanuchus pallidicinctus TaxID=109042 RepID=UPI002286FC3E|nr:cilia- and flagella-associated protein 45 isoform X2 [Tympanuchus pallidicinctus]